jgi:hypothetical protein
MARVARVRRSGGDFPEATTLPSPASLCTCSDSPRNTYKHWSVLQPPCFISSMMSPGNNASTLHMPDTILSSLNAYLLSFLYKFYSIPTPILYMRKLMHKDTANKWRWDANSHFLNSMATMSDHYTTVEVFLVLILFIWGREGLRQILTR